MYLNTIIIQLSILCNKLLYYIQTHTGPFNISILWYIYTPNEAWNKPNGKLLRNSPDVLFTGIHLYGYMDEGGSGLSAQSTPLHHAHSCQNTLTCYNYVHSHIRWCHLESFMLHQNFLQLTYIFYSARTLPETFKCVKNLIRCFWWGI